VTFDDGYTQPAFCRFLDQGLNLPYVGTLSGSIVLLKDETTHRLGGPRFRVFVLSRTSAALDRPRPFPGVALAAGQGHAGERV